MVHEWHWLLIMMTVHFALSIPDLAVQTAHQRGNFGKVDGNGPIGAGQFSNRTGSSRLKKMALSS